MNMSPKAVSRYWSKVLLSNDSNCWTWNGTKRPDGYGQFRLGKKSEGFMLAHRASYYLTFGDIPKGLLVCHTCDNRSCVNPHHLFLGTDRDNSDDKVKKGRQAKGSKVKGNKLTSEQVIAILHEVNTGRNIASKYGVSTGLISLIRSKKRWTYL